MDGKHQKRVFRRCRQELSVEENGAPKRRQGNEERRQSGQAAEEMSDLFYREQATAGDDDDEIRQYLTQASSSRYLSILEFYGTQKSTYPTICRMAKGFLSMMAMSAPSESLFSRVKNIVTNKRNRLDPSTIRMMGILKARGLIRKENIFTDDEQMSIENDRDAADTNGVQSYEEVRMKSMDYVKYIN